MQLTGNARDRMRPTSSVVGDVEVILANPAETREDAERGNQVVAGFVRGRRFRVVIAADEARPRGLRRREARLMRAEYDSRADALAIDLVDDPVVASGEGIDERCSIAFDEHGAPVEVDLLYPSLGISPPLAEAAARFALDEEALLSAANAAVAAPDRVVIIEVKARSLA